MSFLLIVALVALGCFTGFMAGLLGIGGGMIITPFLTALLVYASVPPQYIVHVAIATSLATICFTSMSSVRAHAKRGAVSWRIVAFVAPGILMGALLGSKISSLLSTFWLSLIFACFVGFSAFKMFKNAKPKPSRSLPGPVGMTAAGGTIGIISALVGAGGGFISVPFMLWCNVEMHMAVGTSAALGFPIAAAGTLGYIYNGLHAAGLPQFPMMLGFIHIPALLSIAVASVFTAPIGAKVAHAIDTKPLKRVFACMLCCIAVYMLSRAYQAF